MALSVTSAYSLIHYSNHVHNHNERTGIPGQASLPSSSSSPAEFQSPYASSSSAFKRSSRVLATPEDKNSPVTEVSSESEEQVPTASEKKSQVREAVKKGQTTAIITGAIAVVLGAAYLILVQLLDSRGVNLVPPPPEAFEP